MHELYGRGVHSEIDAVGQIRFRLKCYTPRIVFRGAASKYKCTAGGNSVHFVSQEKFMLVGFGRKNEKSENELGGQIWDRIYFFRLPELYDLEVHSEIDAVG